MSGNNSNYGEFLRHKGSAENPGIGVNKCESGETLIESKSSGIIQSPKFQTKQLSFGNAFGILKKPSSFTSDTMYDHVVEIVKRIIDERPPNVIDYFEQFSRDVRQHKNRHSVKGASSLSQPLESKFLGIARNILKSLRLSSDTDAGELVNEDFFEGHHSSPSTYAYSSESSITRTHRTLSKTEDVIKLQHFWAFCGLGFQIDEVFQLSWAVQKVQTHRGIKSARFWGRLFGTDASYYIVEAELTKTERLLRIDDMETKLVQEMIEFIKRKEKAAEKPDFDPYLIPGHSWKDYPEDVVRRMQAQAPPVPFSVTDERFEMPPEPVGSGLNRKTYYVARSLSEEWQELPTLTPMHVVASRKIRKFLTGNLETKFSSYPTFPGTEGNYLRAIIARITAGTYIAPSGYFRRMTRKEILEEELEDEMHAFDEGEEHESYDSDIDEDNLMGNDCPIIEDETFKPLSVKNLKAPRAWGHCRPHILDQGTVEFIDEETVIRNLTKVALRRMAADDGMGEGGEEFDTESDIEGELEEEEADDEHPDRETGPQLFACAEDDGNSEEVVAWSSRLSENCSSPNQAVIMRSNLWPGAYSFVCGDICDSIYLGWGSKYVARCVVLEHLPEIQEAQCADDLTEVSDPTVEMEDQLRLYHEKGEFRDVGEEISFGVESDNDYEDGDDVNGA